MYDGKRCREALGLEELAVGQNGANSPSTTMVYNKA